MRDKRFQATHRGGPLDMRRHRLLAMQASGGAAERERAWQRSRLPVQIRALALSAGERESAANARRSPSR